MLDETSEKKDAKKQKTAESEVDAAAEAPPVVMVKEEKPKLGQQSIKAMCETAETAVCRVRALRARLKYVVVAPPARGSSEYEYVVFRGHMEYVEYVFTM